MTARAKLALLRTLRLVAHLEQETASSLGERGAGLLGDVAIGAGVVGQQFPQLLFRGRVDVVDLRNVFRPGWAITFKRKNALRATVKCAIKQIQMVN